ncbi:hypothetical protein PI124_g7287 [Phytophthora idaei]|nr:hypothetical protein PI125_g7735 [Phytophthora idaei]KAG3161034.1 hypothetical protein PI126_g6634 [Phytophthora idaei]KAG3248027.1 hypothetical protein PI124_g7287 [Phytophthora idaei]
MKDYGFKQSQAKSCLYFYAKNEAMAFVLVYVDDVIITTNSEDFKCELFSALDNEYGFMDLGLLTSYLGKRVRQTGTEAVLDQEQYPREILEKFDHVEGLSNKCGISMEATAKLRKCKHADEEECNHNPSKVPYRAEVQT